MIFGWDVSTAVVGMVALTDDGSFFSGSFVDLRKVDGGVIEKCVEFAPQCKDFVNTCAARRPFPDPIGFSARHFVEDRLGGFTRGMTTVQTLMKLAEMNGIVRWILRDGGRSTVHPIHTATIKSVMARDGLVIPKGSAREDKKRLTLEHVRGRLGEAFPFRTKKKSGKPQDWCYDVADAFLVARTGFLKGH